MDGIRSRKLYVTVYPKDTEAKRIWHEEVGLPLDHIIDVKTTSGISVQAHVVRIRKFSMTVEKLITI